VRNTARLPSVDAGSIGEEFQILKGMAMGRSSPCGAASAVGVLLMLATLGFVGVARAGDEGLEIELESSTLSLGSESHKLEVVVKSADGEVVPSATVTLISVHSVASGAPVSWSQHNAKFASLGDGKYELEVRSEGLALGKYKVRVDASSEGSKGFLATIVAVTAPMAVSNANVAVFESDGTLVELRENVNLGESVTVSASDSQKLKVGFQVTSPSGASFQPQQVILKLRNVESGAEQTYLVPPASEGYEHTLVFSKMVEKLNYQSGAYSVDVVVGDDVMENSLVWSLVSLDLDLPEAPEGSTPPVAPVSKYAPKAEIVHIFRQPEKRPSTYLSMAFLILTLLPLVGFFVGLQQLGVNLKNLPSGGLPLAASVGFHGGIAMILGLYLMFWLKLNLFTTLQILGFLGLFTLVPGFHILSYLADHSAKVKSA
jgi:oligosaccharyltransferase complex subunit delta (ribophorin II)